MTLKKAQRIIDRKIAEADRFNGQPGSEWCFRLEDLRVVSEALRTLAPNTEALVETAEQHARQYLGGESLERALAEIAALTPQGDRNG
jgi:hypothetical protein